jgi:hypothetical protein
MTLVKEAVAQLRAALMRFEEYPERKHWIEHWDGVARICTDISRQAGCPGVVDAAWCYLTHEIDFGFTDHMRVEFEQAYARLEIV